MVIVRTIPELNEAIGGRPGAFVPTMGALHEGHVALIRHAVDLARPVVVSVFVNPTQFGPSEDYLRYPRMLDADAAKAARAGADVIFAPDVETVYPPNDSMSVPPLPDVAVRPGLEDAHRPGHFAGVCQVVARLFDLVQPRFAIFGEKDYQQLRVIIDMVKQQGDRWSTLEIVPHPTVREPDGLAMSSRNAYLTLAQREQALGLSRALKAASEVRFVVKAEQAMTATLRNHGLDVDYAVVRDAQTLMPMDDISKPARALIAARLPGVRLIDNGAFAPPS
jgi:pantoate--beta-alanine ligase